VYGGLGGPHGGPTTRPPPAAAPGGGAPPASPRRAAAPGGGAPDPSAPLALEPMAWWRTRSCRTARSGPAGRPVGRGGWEWSGRSMVESMEGFLSGIVGRAALGLADGRRGRGIRAQLLGGATRGRRRASPTVGDD